MGVDGVLGPARAAPRARTRGVALPALATCPAVECAKLWQAPWLVEFRGTTVGHLLLGQVFSWPNLMAYAVGASAGAALDRLLFPGRRGERSTAAGRTLIRSRR